MKKTALLSLLAATLLPLAASGQERVQILTMDDATTLFGRFDANKDGLISSAEARPHGMTASQAASYDHDGDGKINKSEFLVAYKKMAEAGGANVSDDLSAKVTRIQADRRIAEQEAKEIAEKRAKANRRIGSGDSQDDANGRAKAKRRQEASEDKQTAESRAAAKRHQEAAVAAQEAARKRAEAERKKAEEKRPRKKPEQKRPSRRNG